MRLQNMLPPLAVAGLCCLLSGCGIIDCANMKIIPPGESEPKTVRQWMDECYQKQKDSQRKDMQQKNQKKGYDNKQRIYSEPDCFGDEVSLRGEGDKLVYTF